eukprot:s1607_g6.t1
MAFPGGYVTNLALKRLFRLLFRSNTDSVLVAADSCPKRRQLESNNKSCSTGFSPSLSTLNELSFFCQLL